MVADLGNSGKWWLDFLAVPAIVILVGVAAFGLGRLSALREAAPGIIIHPPGEQAPQ